MATVVLWLVALGLTIAGAVVLHRRDRLPRGAPDAGRESGRHLRRGLLLVLAGGVAAVAGGLCGEDSDVSGATAVGTAGWAFVASILLGVQLWLPRGESANLPNILAGCVLAMMFAWGCCWGGGFVGGAIAQWFGR